MNIQMLQTVEDSHGYAHETAAGKQEIRYDVRKFIQGGIYGPDTGGPDFERRARGLVRLGYAIEV